MRSPESHFERQLFWHINFRRLAALGILMGGIVCTVILVITPMVSAYLVSVEDYNDQRIRLGTFQTALLRARNETQTKNANQQAAVQGGLWQADNEALAQTAVQTRMQELANTHNFSVRSVRPLPKIESNGLAWVGLSIDGTASDDQIISFLHALETSRPILLIKNAQIRGTGVDDPYTHPQIEAQFDVFGALRDAVGKKP